MDLLYVILTFNRSKVLSSCINTLMNNTSIKPDEVWLLDDGSGHQLRRGLLDLNISHEFNLVLNGKNKGVGVNFEMAYSIIRQKNPKIVGVIESDYIWRNEFMEDIQAVFEANPYTIAIPGCNHPDMYDRSKTHGSFCDLMKDQFGKDIDARQFLYSPFTSETKVGPIKVQGASNSCGCLFLHWERLQQFLFKDLGVEQEYWRWMDRGFHKWGNTNRRYASDAHMSGTLTWYWEQWAKKNNIDISKHFAWLDICDHSIANHLCALGLNGCIPGIQEGQTFVGSPVWPENYQSFSRKKVNK